ncbi:hypothetical protein P3441_22450 [Vibrio parahaemolyticus]|nr:hypothetical protein [Vibrio parahaemolyticus]MDF4452777.1 hypothetical protein [Vibrio parahaemolyticus]
MEKVVRLTPKFSVLRALFARSGNECAFPGCSHPMINHKNQFVGQVCHIEAALPNGERFNIDQSNEGRRAYENLVLFCYAHHVETDDVESFDVEKLKNIKQDHEAINKAVPFDIGDSILQEIESGIHRYWKEFDKLKSNYHYDLDMALDIDSTSSALDVAQETYRQLEWGNQLFHILYETNRSYHTLVNAQIAEKNGSTEDGDFMDEENWEIHNIAIPNLARTLKGNTMLMEVRYLEEYLLNNPNDKKAKARFDLVKESLMNYVLSTHLMD